MNEQAVWPWRPTLLLAVTCVVLCVSFIWLGVAPAQVSSVSEKYRLPLVAGGAISVAPGIETAKIQQAVRAEPIEQAIVNAAMVSSLAERPSRDLKPWLGVVSALGWRNVTAQQNIIAAAIQRDDVASIINSADAMLRVKNLSKEAAAFMNLAEAYPETWPRVFSLLKSNVAWRHDYLGQASSSMAPLVMDGRIRTIAALRRAGDNPDRQQVRPLVAALAAVGRLSEADSIWRDYTGDRDNALYDTRFERALAQLDQPLTPLSFDWSLNLDAGYTTDVAANGLGGSVLTIRWDGRGVPVFFSQQTSAAPGHQVVRARIEGDTQMFADRIGFRLRCGASVVALEPARRPGSADLTLLTENPVSCAFPILEVYGRVGKTVRSFDGALTAISMNSVDAMRPVKQQPK